MKERIKALQLELLDLTGKILKVGLNNSEGADLGSRITVIRETLRVLRYPVKWEYIQSDNTKKDPTDIINHPVASVNESKIYQMAEAWYNENKDNQPTIEDAYISASFLMLDYLGIKTNEA